MAWNVSMIRQQFGFFRQVRPPVYLDSAATAQIPDAVLDTMHAYHTAYRANVHRGMHALAEQATQKYEDSRSTVQSFIHAKHLAEIIFTKNCTEAINLVARSWGRMNLRKEDAVLLTLLEHHSNIVPWLQQKEDVGTNVSWVRLDAEGNLDINDLDEHLSRSNVKLLAITGQSNVLGVRPDLSSIIKKAHAAGALVLVDAAQLIAHHSIDVQALDCDFLTFSGHKLYGPTGIGVLYAKRKFLEAMPPFLGGGMMIHEVQKDRYSPADIPAKFEAGTPPIAEAIGLGAAIEWILAYPWHDIEAHERTLIEAAYTALKKINGLRILGPVSPDNVSGCVSFTIDGVHPHDLTDTLGKQDIALRAGHHCTQPLHKHLGITASTRLSVGMYTTEEEIKQLPDIIARTAKHVHL